MKSSPLLLICILALFSCKDASEYEPIVDNPNAQYRKDLLECQELSRQKRYFDSETGGTVAKSAGAGALIGGLMGGGLQGISTGAAIGAGTGIGSRAFSNYDERKYIIVQCLRNRGHRVIM